MEDWRDFGDWVGIATVEAERAGGPTGLGSVPRTITLRLDRPFVDRTDPGDRVQVSVLGWTTDHGDPGDTAPRRLVDPEGTWPEIGSRYVLSITRFPTGTEPATVWALTAASTIAPVEEGHIEAHRIAEAGPAVQSIDGLSLAEMEDAFDGLPASAFAERGGSTGLDNYRRYLAMMPPATDPAPDPHEP